MVEGSCEIPHGQEVISHIKALPLSMCITSTELWSYSIAERDVDVKDSKTLLTQSNPSYSSSVILKGAPWKMSRGALWNSKEICVQIYKNKFIIIILYYIILKHNNQHNYLMYASINHNFRNNTCIQYAGHKFTLVNQTDKNNVCVLKEMHQL